MWIPMILVIPLLSIAFIWITPTQFHPWLAVTATFVNMVVVIIQAIFGGLSATHFRWTLPPDTISLVVLGVTLFVGFTAALYSVGYIRREHTLGEEAGKPRTYFSLLLAFYWALLAVPLMNNVIVTWAFIEATALASVFLVDYHRTKKTAEASWKYIVLMETGGISALLGTIALLVAEPGTVQVASWTGLATLAHSLPSKWLAIAFVLVLVGYGTKAGLVPFNAWLPDAHSQAPSPVSAMLSAIKLNAAMYGIVRFQSILRADHEGSFANHSLLLIGVLTVLISTLMTIKQRDVKRLFAYSSSENLGLVAIGFALGPIGTLGAYLQMINHSVIKSMLFYESGELLLVTGTTEINRFRGIATQMPSVGSNLLLGMLAIAGAPPFGLFISELVIIFALVHGSSVWLAAFVTMLLAILFANFLFYGMRIGLGKSVSERMSHPNIRSGWTTFLPTWGHTAASLALGIFLPYLLLLGHPL